jgi:hypothetical protein
VGGRDTFVVIGLTIQLQRTLGVVAGTPGGSPAPTSNCRARLSYKLSAMEWCRNKRKLPFGT